MKDDYIVAVPKSNIRLILRVIKTKEFLLNLLINLLLVILCFDELYALPIRVKYYIFLMFILNLSLSLFYGISQNLVEHLLELTRELLRAITSELKK